MSETAEASLNAAQRLNLRVGCEYIDKMLGEVERVIDSGESASPFSRYQMDISPAQGRVLEDYIRRFRSQILRALAWQNMKPPAPEIPATRAIATRLNFVDIAISDMRPRGMRGTGALPERTAAELIGVLSELAYLSESMMTYMNRALGESFQERIDKLNGSSLLRRIEEVITARGLVQFRPRLEILLSRLEDTSFEVAVFGRVSSGKSSFLNALLQSNLLPVGTNPITAVPTRIQYGPSIKALVRFGSTDLKEIPLEQFRESISESGNPGNQQGIRRALLIVPAQRLTEGIVLVDTPGLGSLALEGAGETLAYLPSCDLALLLVDAGSTLTPEDIGTLRLIVETGIPAIVLLSKSDLLQEQDRRSSIAYIQRQIAQEVRVQVQVHPISSLSQYDGMVDNLYEEELKSRFQQSEQLKRQSINGKLRRLQTDLVAWLEAQHQRAKREQPLNTENASSLEKLLLDAAAGLGSLERTLQDRTLHVSVEASELLNRVSGDQAASAKNCGGASISLEEVTRSVQSLVEAEVSDLMTFLAQAASHATTGIVEVGRQLASGDLPDEREIKGLIRGAPRFEIPALSGNIELGLWRYLGEGRIRRRILGSLQKQLRPLLEQELGAYGSALQQWAKQVTQSIQFTLNSFADVYRASLQEVARSTDSSTDAPQIREAIEYLKAEDVPALVGE